MLTPLFIIYFCYFDFIFMLLFFLYTTNINYQNIVEKNFIYYYIIAIKWGESTHLPGRIDPGWTGNRGETTRYVFCLVFSRSLYFVLFLLDIVFSAPSSIYSIFLLLWDLKAYNLTLYDTSVKQNIIIIDKTGTFSCLESNGL